MDIGRALGEYVLHRAFERAKVQEWCEALGDAGTVLAELAVELEHEAARQGTANNARAGDILPIGRIRVADLRLRGLRGDQATFEARRIACGPLARETYERATAPHFTVASLGLGSLETLGGFFRRQAARMRGWDERFTRGSRRAARAGRSGRLPDVAAAQLVSACRAEGRSLRAVAREAIDLGIEKPRARPGDDGAALLADRWRKAAAARRKK